MIRRIIFSLGFLCLGLLFPFNLFSIEYEVEIIIQDEDDIEELYLNGDISAESKEKLLYLLNNKVELNSASRDALYDLPGITMEMADAIIRFREEVRSFKKVKDLLKVKEIPQDVYIQIEPFVFVKVPPKKLKPKIPAVRGSFRLKAVDSFTDNYPPEGYIRLRAESGKFNMGLVGLSRNRLFGVRFDEEKGVLVAEDEHSGFEIPKGYIYSEGRNLKWLVGSYTAGFGQRLVFDNTSKDKPHGWYQDDLIYDSSYDTTHPRYKPYKKLLGATFQMEKVYLGSGWFDFTGFLSYHPWLDIYQYDFKYMGYDAGYGCDEPPCSDLIDSTGSSLRYKTIPSAYTEALGGANFTYNFAKRKHIGITGYMSNIQWNLDAPDIQFTNSPIPNRSSFGAFGFDGAYGIKWFDLYTEFAGTDSGGWAGIVRGIISRKRLEIDTSIRNYTTDFDNPHSRGLSQPDEVDYDEDYYYYYYEKYWTHADRDRDEQGYLFKLTYRPIKQLKLRAQYDIWRHPSNGIIDTEIYGRADYTPIREVTLTSYYEYRDNDIKVGGRDEDYDESGARHYIAGQIKTSFIPLTTLYLFYKHYWIDSTYSETEFQQDHYTYLKGLVKPFTGNTITARVKYYDENIDSPSSGDKYIETYLQVYQRIARGYQVGGRYTFYYDLEEDANDEERAQHILRILLEGKF